MPLSRPRAHSQDERSRALMPLKARDAGEGSPVTQRESPSGVLPAALPLAGGLAGGADQGPDERPGVAVFASVGDSVSDGAFGV